MISVTLFSLLCMSVFSCLVFVPGLHFFYYRYNLSSLDYPLSIFLCFRNKCCIRKMINEIITSYLFRNLELINCITCIVFWQIFMFFFFFFFNYYFDMDFFLWCLLIMFEQWVGLTGRIETVDSTSSRYIMDDVGRLVPTALTYYLF